MADQILQAYVFPSPGPENTEITLRASKLGIRYIVVASVTGRTALEAKNLSEQLRYSGRLVMVTQHTGWAEAGKSQMKEKNRKLLRGSRCQIVTSTHALSSIARSYRTKFGGIDLLEIVAEAFRRFSQGVKAAIESAIMAADAGAIPVDEDIIAIAGTGTGADSAIVIRAANQNRFFDMKVREVIAMPR